MERVAAYFLVLLAGSHSVQAQQLAKLEFEVASVKQSPPPPAGVGSVVFCRGGPGTNDPALYTCGNINLSALIGTAYHVAYYQLSAPDWMLATRFDVRAVVPEGTTKEQFSIMLQNLLADRFKVKVHRESREIQRYELVVTKNGPKFKEATPAVPQDERAAIRPGFPVRDKDGYPVIGTRGGMAISYGKARAYWPGITMELLAGQLSGQLQRPVTDATGLPGKYDISLYWDAEITLRASAPGADLTAAAIDSGPTLTQALQDQLGLRVESRKGPVDFVVVDHAEKVPAEN